jgi:LPS-assembly lipoprotein
MSSSSRRFVLAFVALVTVAGCGLTPVYQSGADPTLVDRIGYAEPTSRAEQVIYQALKFSLGEGPSAPLLLTASVETDISAVSRVQSDDPATPYRLEMTARYTLVDGADPETVLLSERRAADATFTRGPQASANAAAEADAEERAARRLADIIRARLLIYLRTAS